MCCGVFEKGHDINLEEIAYFVKKIIINLLLNLFEI